MSGAIGFTERLRKKLGSPIKHPLLTFARWSQAVRGLPAQSPEDMFVIKQVLLSQNHGSLRVLEWGAGRSTVYYPKFLRSVGRSFEWHAVDNSSVWSEYCRGRIGKAHLEDQVRISCFEFPAFWELPSYTLGHPVVPENLAALPAVADYVGYPQRVGGRFDAVIVDGRFRRRCLLAAREVLAPRGIVILHDAQRTHYHSSLSAFPRVLFLDTGVILGTSQKSKIALCGPGDDATIDLVAERYRSRWPGG